MTSPVTLYPNGNGTFPTGWGGSGTPAGNYTELKDGSDSTFASVAANSVSAYYLFDNCPSDLYEVTGVSFSFRCSKSGKSPARNFTTIQCVKSDELTVLTNTADVSGGATTATTITGSLTLSGAVDKTSWDGMRLKITSASTGTGSAFLYEVSITLTYDTAPAGFSSVQVGRNVVGRGIGRGILRGVNRVWTPPVRQIYVPAFCQRG